MAQSEPGVSVYVLPPPTPVSLETVEKALRSLPHMALVCLIDTVVFFWVTALGLVLTGVFPAQVIYNLILH